MFDNAIKIPNKRETLLLEAVINHPSEDILAYIFKNYKEERKNVYAIGNVVGLDFGVYMEEIFKALYTDEVKLSEQEVEKVKNEIILTMKEYGIKSSDTLNQINYDELTKIARKYVEVAENEDIQKYLAAFNKYDAPVEQKKQIIQEKGIWQLATEYSVTYTVEEIESILKRYYSVEAQHSEEEAQRVKKQIIEIMNALNIQASDTFDQLERDCLARIIENLKEADEEMCKAIREQVASYDALEKNKKEYFDKIEKRIEEIWAKEDGEVFDNVYLNTDIYNQNEIDSAIEFIRQNGRTSNAERYIDALQACNAQNIENAKKFQEKSTKNSKTIGIVLVVVGIVCLIPPLTLFGIIVAISGLILLVRYNKLKKNWNILTIDGTRIHSAIMNTNTNSSTKVMKEGISK